MNRLTQDSYTDAKNPTQPKVTSYAYGSTGNRTSKTETQGLAKTVTSYLYDADDRLSSETKTSGTISATTSYLWDANGNLTQKVEPTQTTLYTWDSNNRLVEVKRGGIAATASSVATYQYDANGNRVGKTTADGKIVAYLVDSNLPYAQVAQEKTTLGAVSDTTTYLYGIERIQMTRAGQGTYYHDDGLGSTRVLTDQTGNLTDSYDYDDYGALQSQTGTTKNDFLFAGEQFDVEAGLYYNRARHLDVNTGRFTGLDPFAGNPSQPVTLNKYLYASADPVNQRDPSGLQTLGGQMVSVEISSQMFGLSGQVSAELFATKTIFEGIRRLTFMPYSKIVKLKQQGAGIWVGAAREEVHHLIEKRLLDKSPELKKLYPRGEASMEAVSIDKKLHRYFTNRWTNEIAKKGM